MISVICDGNSEIGLGHFYRCLSIIRELESDSRDVMLFIPDEDLLDSVKEYKVNYRIISGLYDNTEALHVLMDELEKCSCRVVLIDTHRMDQKSLSALHSIYKVVFIDDLIEFPYPVDVIVNGHIDVDQEQYLRLYEKSEIPSPVLLIGAKYFATHIKKIEKQVSNGNLLVGFFAGGSDPGHVTLKMVEFLRDSKMTPSFRLLVVVGNMNKDYEKIRNIVSTMPFVELFYSEKDLSSIYHRIDVAISAAGLTLYELVCLGIPTIAYSMVNNQIHTVVSFERLGLSINVGDSRYDPVIERMFNCCQTLLSDVDRPSIVRLTERVGLDGKGAKRIAKVLEYYEDAYIS